MKEYTWALDGYGRAFICYQGSVIILYCMLPKYGGMCGVFDLEDQDLKSTEQGENND